jgi:hypothetical protein
MSDAITITETAIMTTADVFDELETRALKAHRKNRYEIRQRAKIREQRLEQIADGSAPIKDVAIIEFFNLTGILTTKRQWRLFDERQEMFSDYGPTEHLIMLKQGQLTYVFDYANNSINVVNYYSESGKPMLTSVGNLAAIGRHLTKKV